METPSINPPSVVLIGFSTAGKSHYLREIQKVYFEEFITLDSDKFVSSNYDEHIYNVFMKHGHKAALEFIEAKEKEFISFVTTNIKKPQLIAAGPVLVQRSGWTQFVNERKPFVIHIDKSAESIYKSLLDRKKDQKRTLNQLNPNFGCWDKDVTTELHNGVYRDLPENESLVNIRTQLSYNNPAYIKYRNVMYDSDLLRSNEEMQNELINLIVDKLRKNHG